MRARRASAAACRSTVDARRGLSAARQRSRKRRGRGKTYGCKTAGFMLAEWKVRHSRRWRNPTFYGPGMRCHRLTALPDASWARERKLPYAMWTMVTDFDCWHPVRRRTVDQVIRVLKRNAARPGALRSAWCRNGGRSARTRRAASSLCWTPGRDHRAGKTATESQKARRRAGRVTAENDRSSKSFAYLAGEGYLSSTGLVGTLAIPC